jgi:hypothetical protein
VRSTRTVATALLGALTIALLPARVTAAGCDGAALTTVRYYLEDRDAGEYRRAQRYLSPDFGPRFREIYEATYLDYMSDADVRWRQATIQGSASGSGSCTVSVTATRDAAGGSAAVAETYTLAQTYQGWRIEEWRWQPAP